MNQNICPQTKPLTLILKTMQHPDLFKGLKTYRNAVIPKRKPYCTIFRQYTVQRNEINRQIQVVEFTSKHSQGLNKPNLIIMLHQLWKNIMMMWPSRVGINAILRSKHYEEFDKLPRNIKFGNACQKYNIGKTYISNTSINKNKY